MNISVFSSDSFFVGARIMILSFLENNNFEKHNIFVISPDLKEIKIRKFNKYIKKKYNQEVSLIRLTEEMKKGFPEYGLFGAAGYHKLYIFEYLPKELERIMCIDADAFILGNIKDFYYQDMRDCVIVASEDSHIKEDVEHLEELNISIEDDYYNMGCIVIDLSKYLNEYSREEYIEWINENEKKLKYVAQDVINLLFKDKIKKVDYKLYNRQIIFHEELSEEQYSKILDECLVFHSIGKIKPWDFRYEHIFSRYIFSIMKKNGMKKELFTILLKKKLFIIKYKVLDILKRGSK